MACPKANKGKTWGAADRHEPCSARKVALSFTFLAAPDFPITLLENKQAALSTWSRDLSSLQSIAAACSWGYSRCILLLVMRRIVTITLLFAIGLPVGMSFAQSAAIGPVPICCRRNGTHHCAAMTPESPNSGSAVGRKTPPCPYRTFLHQSRADEYGPTAVVRELHPLLSYSRASVQAVIDYVVSDARTHHKRGPPSHLS